MRHRTNFLGLIILLTITAESLGQSKDRKVTIIVKDPSKYSKTFIDGLRDIGPGKKFELKDDSIITDDKYRSNFSQLLPENKEIILRGQRNGRKFKLRLNRVNYTTIRYDFYFVDEKGNTIRDNGQADKSPQFMLGPESDEDENGIGYFCSEYFALDKKQLNSIRIGLRGKKYLAKVNGAIVNFSVDNCPTLQ